MPRIKKVSPRDTKQDILDAYQDLLSEVVQGDTEQVTPKTITTSRQQVTDWQTTVKDQIANLQINLTTTLEDLTQKIQAGSQTLELLLQAQAAVEENTQQAQTKVDKLRKQEEEDYQYDLTKRKQRQEAELKEAQEAHQKLIAEREETLKAAEDELKDLRKLRDGLQAQIDKAVADAVAMAVKEATSKLNQEQALLKQEALAKEQLLKQQVTYLQDQIAKQADEIKRLQQESAQASQYVTRIAERAVEKPAQMTSAGSGEKS